LFEGKNQLTVLIFGFGPFLEYKENPSGLIAQSLNGHEIAGHRVKGIALPTEYSRIEELIVAALNREKPTLALGLGLAAGRNVVTPEKIAVNYKHATEPDNTGKIILAEKIDAAQPDGLFANFPVEGLVEELNHRGVPSSLSLSAGAYLCNNAMFLIVREAHKAGFNGGFIHIPCHSEYVAREQKNLPSLPLSTIEKGVELSIEYILSQTRPKMVVAAPTS
jgi:pyroglutamyl-peptidase